MFGFGKLKNYISGADRFLKRFNKEHPELTESQQQEVNKHARIHLMRDTKVTPEKDIWKDF